MKLLRPLLSLAFGLVLIGGLTGCVSGNMLGTPPEQDRQAILGMAGTYAVSFDFEETLALRDGYELHEPYHQEAEELVVVAEDRGGFITLQHILVVRFEGETHVINHWRQDWRYEGEVGYSFAGENRYEPVVFGDAQREGAWVQSVYNVADSPRYTNIGRWVHRNGVSTWTGSDVRRPIPLREHHLRDQYTFLDSVNTIVVTDRGWLHLQENQKLDTNDVDQPVLALERGMNRYERVADEDFEQAHDYWQNTHAFWAEVRGVWADVLAEREPITLRSQWMGESLFVHLNGLSDDYWGDDDTSDAVPEIEEVIEAFLSEGPET